MEFNDVDEVEVDEVEPPKKMMKYENDNLNRKVWKSELELVQFKIGYLTKKGNILLDIKNIEDSEYTDDNYINDEYLVNDNDNDCIDYDTILRVDSNNKPIEVYILNFQTFEGGEAYLISNNNDNTDKIRKIDINKGYTINEIFNNFMKGDYFIGILHHYYKTYYRHGIITNVSTFNDKNNDEIKLHYTQDRSYKGNVAWRTITWDLFENFVPNCN